MTTLKKHIDKMNSKDAYKYLINLINNSIIEINKDIEDYKELNTLEYIENLYIYTDFIEELNLYINLKKQLETNQINNIFIDWFNRTNILGIK